MNEQTLRQIINMQNRIYWFLHGDNKRAENPQANMPGGHHEDHNANKHPEGIGGTKKQEKMTRNAGLVILIHNNKVTGSDPVQ